MHFDATSQTTLCTFHRHDYGSFQQFFVVKRFFAVHILAVQKMCTFAHLIYCFVVKTKITIWAESICGISPLFFLFKSFTGQ